MVSYNIDNYEIVFIIFIDYLLISIGIFVEDRVLIVKMVVNDSSKVKDFRCFGYLFFLLVKEGGVLVRNGYIEVIVDLCCLVGLKECGFCCEIMVEDGSMMRKDELLVFV